MTPSFSELSLRASSCSAPNRAMLGHAATIASCPAALICPPSRCSSSRTCLLMMVTVDLGNDVGVGTVVRPIWRIDEGLVFGNFTYFPNQLYVEVVELAVGRHTLHTGIEYSGQLNCRGEGVHCNYINKRWGRSTIQVATLDSVLVLPFEPHVNSYGTDANGNDVLSMIPETNNSDRIAATWAETNQTQSLDEDHVPCVLHIRTICGGCLPVSALSST